MQVFFPKQLLHSILVICSSFWTFLVTFQECGKFDFRSLLQVYNALKSIFSAYAQLLQSGLNYPHVSLIFQLSVPFAFQP